MKKNMKSKIRRKKYQGTVEKHGRVFRVRVRVNGQDYTRSFSTANREEAEKLAEEFIAPFRAKGEEMRAEALLQRYESAKGKERQSCIAHLPAMPLGIGFNAYLMTEKAKKASDSTRSMYSSQYDRFLEWMRKSYPEMTEMRQITRIIAREFCAEIAAHFSHNTHNKYVTLFSQIWDALMKEDEIREESQQTVLTAEESVKYARLEINPWKSINKLSLREDSVSRRPLTIDEMISVMSHVKGELRILFAIAMYTGLRMSDIVLLDWRNVDLMKNSINVIPRKTKSRTGIEVCIPLHPVLGQILHTIAPDNRIGYVLPESACAYLHNDSEFGKKVNKVFDDCGITRHITVNGRARCLVSLHSMRHTLVTIAANSGAPIELVRQLVGHGNPEMTRQYAHASLSSLQPVINLLPDVTSSAPSDRSPLLAGTAA